MSRLTVFVPYYRSFLKNCVPNLVLLWIHDILKSRKEAINYFELSKCLSPLIYAFKFICTQMCIMQSNVAKSYQEKSKARSAPGICPNSTMYSNYYMFELSRVQCTSYQYGTMIDVNCKLYMIAKTIVKVKNLCHCSIQKWERQKPERS